MDTSKKSPMANYHGLIVSETPLWHSDQKFSEGAG